MKGFLIWHDQPFPDEVVEFTKYASIFRYPGEVDEPSVEEATAVLNRGRVFVEALLARLPEEAH